MSEYRLKQEHLQDYTGILTSHNENNGKFKMALKVEDNPVLKNSILETIIVSNYKYIFISRCPEIIRTRPRAYT